MNTSTLSKGILTHILNAVAASHTLAFAYSIDQHIQDTLGDPDYQGFRSYSIAFKGKDTAIDCSSALNLAFEHVGQAFTNEGGDTAINFKLQARVNYSTHGASTPEEALARAVIILDTAKLAQELEALFGDEFEVVTCTQEQMARSEEAQQLNTMRTFFTTLSEKARNHQRVGTPRTVSVSDETALKYMATKKALKFAVGDRTYVVTMTDKKDAEGKVIFGLERLV